MGTDKTDPLKQKTQIFLLSVLVVRFDEGLEIVSPSMSARCTPIVVKCLQNPVSHF
jgi:hypothetical protein